MKTITKELNLLDIEDIERAISAHLGREVKIQEVECTLTHCIPADTLEPGGAFLDFVVGDECFDSFDLFMGEESDGHYLDGKLLSLDAQWASTEEIFSFDVSAFKSFESLIDGSD